MAGAQSEESPEDQSREQLNLSQEELQKIWEEKEMNQGIMMAFIGIELTKRLLEELFDGYTCKFVISPPFEACSDYIIIFNYETKMHVAYIGVSETEGEAMVVLRAVTKNINKLPFKERAGIDSMLRQLSDDFKIPIKGKITL